VTELGVHTTADDVLAGLDLARTRLLVGEAFAW
jgi:hypothetical protein